MILGAATIVVIAMLYFACGLPHIFMIKKTITLGLIIGGLAVSGLALAAGNEFIPGTNHAYNTTGSVCIKEAIGKRESAILNAFTSYQTAVTNLLNNRQAALLHAWDYTGDQRKELNKAAWDNWRTNITSVRNGLRSAKASAWGQFKTDRTLCGIKDSTDTGTSSMDSLL